MIDNRRDGLSFKIFHRFVKFRQTKKDEKVMATKKWAFLMKTFATDSNTNESVELGVFEIVGLSPYKLPPQTQMPIDTESNNYVYNINAAAMGDFISHIGEKNALIIRKLHDPNSQSFTKAKQDGEIFPAINLYITLITPSIVRLKGAARLKALESQSMEMVSLREVSVREVSPIVYYYTAAGTIYDFIALEVMKTKTLFKGKEW